MPNNDCFFNFRSKVPAVRKLYIDFLHRLPNRLILLCGEEEKKMIAERSICCQLPLSDSLSFRQHEINMLLEQLWESSVSNNCIFDELLPLLKEDEDIDGLCSLLISVKDLPEKWQADLLNFSLEKIDSSDLKERSRILDILLSVPYSSVILLNCLRRILTTSSTVKVLEYLTELLKSSRWTKISGNNEPEIGQVVDWISLILDAHHHELLIAGNNENIKNLIKMLGQLVNEKYGFLEGLGQSEPFIILLEQKRRPPENRRKD